MFVGTLMSINCTPSSAVAATTAYVLFPHVNVSTPDALPSSSKLFAPSVAVPNGIMFAGSLMSIICTPLSPSDPTIAYVLEPKVNVSTSSSPSR